MRPYGLMSLALLTACTGEDNQGNGVDVSAAAERAEADIADYAAQRRNHRAARQDDQRLDPPADANAKTERPAQIEPMRVAPPGVVMPATVSTQRRRDGDTAAK